MDQESLHLKEQSMVMQDPHITTLLTRLTLTLEIDQITNSLLVE